MRELPGRLTFPYSAICASLGYFASPTLSHLLAHHAGQELRLLRLEEGLGVGAGLESETAEFYAGPRSVGPFRVTAPASVRAAA